MSHELTLESLLAGLNKEASEEVTEIKPATAGEELKTALTKQAGEDPTMSTTAKAQGVLLADAVINMLTKQASEQANLAIAAQDSLVSDQNDETELNPEGSANGILQGLLQNASAKGAVDPDGMTDIHVGGTGAAGEGAADGATGEVKPAYNPNLAISDDRDGDDNEDEEVEKTAAVIELVNHGYSFDDAVDMVKVAAAQLAEEHEGQVKAAAVNELMANGIDFDTAVELVKEAGVLALGDDGIKGALRRGAAKAGKSAAKAGKSAKRIGETLIGSKGKELADGASRAAASGRMASAARLGDAATRSHQATSNARKAVGALGAAAAIGGIGGAAAMHKKAAVDRLMDAGIDFDNAVALVNILAE